MKILGISAYYHDSAAALIEDGEILAAAQEERFTRKKHDPDFPAHAIRFCLKQAGVSLEGVDIVAFYDKPLLKFDRLLETYIALAPRGFSSFVTSMPLWLKDKLYLKALLRRELEALSVPHDGREPSPLPRLLFAEHHQSHAASAFYPSPFPSASVLCLDGVGEWATTTAWKGDGSRLTPLWEIAFPHSLGLLYSAFTSFTGFKVNSGEYKLMGLAPYGEPRFEREIRDNLIDIKEDGTYRLNLDYFDFATGLRMTSRRFDRLFGGPPRKPESPLTQREMDLARSIQVVTEDIVLKLARTLHREDPGEALCLAGGVALNCVANGRLLREGPYKKLWIQPAAGDAGGAIGAALSAWHQYKDGPRPARTGDAMKGAFLGPEHSNDEAQAELARLGARFSLLPDDKLFERTAEALAAGEVVGWFQGRAEFGPRALGNRSILGDARSPRMQSVMNMKIKHRESFRPFAPAVLKDEVSKFFDFEGDSPYMLLVAPVRKELRIEMTAEESARFGIDKLHVARSSIPAVTHVDYSARLQTVDGATQPRFDRLLRYFAALTGCPLLVNTSFNVRGEPIVGSPTDAFRCFMRTEMDALVIGNLYLRKNDQPAPTGDESWKSELTLD